MRKNEDMDCRDCRILIVEDNDINRVLAERMVKRLGYHCDSVDDGSKVIRALKAEAFDIVLMDLQMPEMDGFTATEQIFSKQNILTRVPTVIAMTANYLPEDIHGCQQVGMVDLIPKPLCLETMKQILAKWRPEHQLAKTS